MDLETVVYVPATPDGFARRDNFDSVALADDVIVGRDDFRKPLSSTLHRDGLIGVALALLYLVVVGLSAPNVSSSSKSEFYVAGWGVVKDLLSGGLLVLGICLALGTLVGAAFVGHQTQYSIASRRYFALTTWPRNGSAATTTT